MKPSLTDYTKRFATLRTNRSNAWGPETRGRAPHKAFFLLAVVDSFAVEDDYSIRPSRQLAAEENMPGHLHTLGGRPLIGPQERVLWPFWESLRWHRENRFRR